MAYIPNNIIADSWSKIVSNGNVTNKFLGLIHIMKLIQENQSIQALHQYTFTANLLSQRIIHVIFLKMLE